MPFNVRMGVPEMVAIWNDLSARKLNGQLDKNEEKFFKKLVKVLGYLGENPRHPSLQTHEIDELTDRYGFKVFEAYLENNTPSAGRVFWAYGPDKGDITVLGVEPHPDDKKGAYIAWRKCAAILHSADIISDENDVIAQMIAKMKSVIPAEALANVRPVVCGGDTFDDLEHKEDPAVPVFRKRITQILKEAGFGKPFARWNDKCETVDLVANLDQGSVSIFLHQSSHELKRWSITGDLNQALERRLQRGRSKKIC